MLKELQTRSSQDQIYTYVGEILVSVNPYKWIDGLYSDMQAKKYCMVGSRGDLPPHVFAVADMAFTNMKTTGGNQVCVISGESGAGKTETAKLFVKQLIRVSSGCEIEGLHNKLVQVNPLLEAFGNAQTLMNDNSSRFGKFTEVVFTPEGCIRGATMKEYLLEKSRCVSQADGERNFHVFYLIFAADAAERERLQLGDPGDYRYINGNMDAVDDIKSQNTQEMRQELMECIDIVGFTDLQKEEMFNILSGILHMGEIVFENDEAAQIVSPKGLMDTVCKQLGIDELSVEMALTRSINIIRGEETERAYKPEQAEDCRDATTKALYSRLFSWIVVRCNELLGVRERERKRTDKSVGILDIFGFECFDENSFEQLCINLANEQLQFFFNDHIFRMELTEYAKEGIDGTQISYQDNQPLLDILLLSKPLGLIAILDEESNFPKASDTTMIEKFHAAFSNKKDYQRPRGNDDYFTLSHYAGEVRYEGYGFLEKNRDTLAVDVMGALRVSENSLVKLLFGGAEEKKAKRGGAGAKAGRGKMDRKQSKARMRQSIKHARASLAKKKKVTVASLFKSSLAELMIKLNSAQPHFVRTVKPNTTKEAGVFDEDMVAKQLKYCGMMETTRIRREGYPSRPVFSEFVRRYKVLAMGRDVAANAAGCRSIMDNAKIQGYQIGKTKVFMRYYHVDQLGALIKPILMAAGHLQAMARGFNARSQVKRLIAEKREFERKVDGFVLTAERYCSNTYDVVAQLCDEDENRPKDFWNTPFDRKKSKKMNTAKKKKMQRAASVKWYKDVEKEKGSGIGESGDFAGWFHGVITRSDADALLNGHPPGTFLIRVAESRFGYSLSLTWSGRSKHFMVDVAKETGQYQVIGNDRTFQSLNELVAHHSKHPVTNDGDLLSYPCPVEDKRKDLKELN